MSSVETIIKFAVVEPVWLVEPLWLLVFLPVGLVLAVLLQTVRCWLAR